MHIIHIVSIFNQDFNHSVFSRRSWFLLYHFHHLSFDSLFFEGQSVLVPDKIWNARVDLICPHAYCKLIDNKFVIWILSEAKLFAVRENFSKTFWVILRQGLNSHFSLFLFDVGILFSL